MCSVQQHRLSKTKGNGGKCLPPQPLQPFLLHARHQAATPCCAKRQAALSPICSGTASARCALWQCQQPGWRSDNSQRAELLKHLDHCESARVQTAHMTSWSLTWYAQLATICMVTGGAAIRRMSVKGRETLQLVAAGLKSAIVAKLRCRQSRHVPPASSARSVLRRWVGSASVDQLAARCTAPATTTGTAQCAMTATGVSWSCSDSATPTPSASASSRMQRCETTSALPSQPATVLCSPV